MYPIILNDHNVSMTKGSKNMASYKKSASVAQFAPGWGVNWPSHWISFKNEFNNQISFSYFVS